MPSAITVDSINIVNNTIVDADINASAAINLSKLATGALPSGITVASANIVNNTIINEDINASASIIDTKLATISTAGKVSNSATTATNANTASAIVARDASGNFSAGTITAALTGNASTATTLATSRTIGGVSFNGSANINLPGVNTAGNQNTSGNAATATTATNFAGIPATTVMLFQQTTPPLGWTKLTTHNNKALRVVNGTVSSGGTSAFTTVFASRTPGGTLSGTNISGAVTATTLLQGEIPSHLHGITGQQIAISFNSGGSEMSVGGANSNLTRNSNSNTPAGGSHTHGFTQPTWSGNFVGAAMDFAVQYVDVIFASKD